MIREELLEFIAGWESLKLRSSEDRVVPGIYDIGYGHVIDRSEHPMIITRERAMEMLREDVSDISEQVTQMVTVPVLPHEHDALVSFAYNVGVKALRDSTLMELLNATDYEGASRQFRRWNKAGGRIVNGLVKRRKAEEALFSTADYSGRP